MVTATNEANMKTRINGCIAPLALAVMAAGLTSGCATKGSTPKEERVSIAQMSPPARATVQRVTASGRVDQITKEVERGRTVYDVEATVDGKHVEFLIGDAEGAVLGAEVPIEFAELPEAVRAAAEKYFGSTAGLKAMKGVEYNETTYEIEGPRNGKTVEITLDPKGKPAR